MKRGTKTFRWDKEDPNREMLRRLAHEFGSDYSIAAIMGCTPVSASWQRRKHRIKLNKQGPKSDAVCASWRESTYIPMVYKKYRRTATPKPVVRDDVALSPRLVRHIDVMVRRNWRIA